MQTPGRAGEPPMRRRHERRGLLVAGQHQLDRRIAERLDDVEIFLARHAEDPVDAFILECRDEQIRTLDH